MWPQKYLILLGCLLTLAFVGCKKGKEYPTAQAPKTITAPPPKPMKPTVDEDDDDLDDDDYADDDDPPVRASGRSSNVGGTRMALPRARPKPAVVKTINGHPKGPKAEVFNAVTRTALPNAAPCFQKHAKGGGTVSINVAMTVGTTGAVEEAKVASGVKNPSLRKCVVEVVKRLTFPAFEGPKVNKTIPFTAVRSGR